LAEIQGSFAEIQGSFAKIQGSFAEIESSFAQIQGSFKENEARQSVHAVTETLVDRRLKWSFISPLYSLQYK